MRKALKLLLILALFFILGTSTSVDLPILEYDCLVEYENNNIILTSQSNINIEGANLQLILNSTQEERAFYFRNNYSLEGMGFDSIPVAEFFNVLDSMPFPAGQIPSEFIMGFSRLDTIYHKEHLF